MAFGVYMALCALAAIMSVRGMLAAPFLIIFSFGFLSVSVLSFPAERARHHAAAPVELTEPVSVPAE